MRQVAEWFVAFIEIGGAAMIGNDLGAWLKRRRAKRDAIERVIEESDAYRADARRRRWAA